MKHFLRGNNIGLDLCRQLVSENYSHVFVTDKIVDDSFVSNKSRERGYVFPLYLYPDNTKQLTTEAQPEKVANLNLEIVNKIADKLNYLYVEDDNIAVDLSSEYAGTLYPIDILDYIYAVLHSPAYREKYKEFLKIDFPRVPYPTNRHSFDQLVELGGQLRQIHLLESPV